MRKNKNLLYLFFAVSIALVSCIGMKPVSISMKTGRTFKGRQLFLDIERIDDSIKVKYIILDSISYLLYEDTLFEKSRLSFIGLDDDDSGKRDSLKIYRSIMDSLEHKYSYFTTDSCMIDKTKYRDYTRIVNVVSHSSKDELLHQEKNKYIVTADGIAFRFQIKVGNRIKKVAVRSPEKDMYPELTELITKSFDLFRDGNGTKSLVGTERTLGR